MPEARGGGWTKCEKGVKRYKLPVINKEGPGDEVKCTGILYGTFESCEE